jgi:hypothetical protein
MGHARQGSFFKSSKFQFQHGGELRRKRAGRGKRPLSTKDSLHVVFKMNREAHRPGLRHYKNYTLSILLQSGGRANRARPRPRRDRYPQLATKENKVLEIPAIFASCEKLDRGKNSEELHSA